MRPQALVTCECSSCRGRSARLGDAHAEAVETAQPTERDALIHTLVWLAHHPALQHTVSTQRDGPWPASRAGHEMVRTGTVHLDLSGSASRQHFVDTGRYLTLEGVDVVTDPDHLSPARAGFLARVLSLAAHRGVLRWARIVTDTQGLGPGVPGWTDEQGERAVTSLTLAPVHRAGEPVTVGLHEMHYALLRAAAADVSGLDDLDRATLILCHLTNDPSPAGSEPIDARLAAAVLQIATLGSITH